MRLSLQFSLLPLLVGAEPLVGFFPDSEWEGLHFRRSFPAHSPVSCLKPSQADKCWPQAGCSSALCPPAGQALVPPEDDGLLAVGFLKVSEVAGRAGTSVFASFGLGVYYHYSTLLLERRDT